MNHDTSHEAWITVAEGVEADPEGATPKELRRAIQYLQYQRAALILKARRRGQPRPVAKLEVIDTRIEMYVALLNGDEHPVRIM